MPNWCYNNVTVSHDNPELIAKFVKATEEGNLFNTFAPMPEEIRNTSVPSEHNQALIEKYGGGDWYSWSIRNWGTKWDIADSFVSEISEDKLTAIVSFSTAWSPPIEFFETLVGLEFAVDAIYTEESMSFAGRYKDGHDECLELNFDKDSQEWIDSIEDQELRYTIQDEYDSWSNYHLDDEE
jgi:hypothetical protein